MRPKTLCCLQKFFLFPKCLTVCMVLYTDLIIESKLKSCCQFSRRRQTHSNCLDINYNLKVDKSNYFFFRSYYLSSLGVCFEMRYNKQVALWTFIFTALWLTLQGTSSKFLSLMLESMLELKNINWLYMSFSLRIRNRVISIGRVFAKQFSLSGQKT